MLSRGSLTGKRKQRKGEKIMHKIVVSTVLMLALFGCMVGPNYQRPVVEPPPSFRFEEKEARDLANTAWWEQFGDSVLNGLIQIALQENKDVKAAAARIEQFVGQYVTTRAALFPQIGAGATGGMQRATEQGFTPFPSSVKNPNDYWEIFLNGNWEIDIWGKIRRATEASRAQILSSEEGRRTVILTLVASVAGTYIDLRDADMEWEISKKTAEAYR
jgi:multidrug efflux system outer membrane protein